MTAILGGWNPTKWDWPDLDDAIARTARDDVVLTQWGVSRRRHGVGAGDRFYLLRHGPAPRGIVASGTVTSPPYPAAHWDGTPGRTIQYVDVELDRVLHPHDPLPIELLRELCPRTNWAPQSSGTSVRPDDEDRLEELWQDHLAR